MPDDENKKDDGFVSDPGGEESTEEMEIIQEVMKGEPAAEAADDLFARDLFGGSPAGAEEIAAEESANTPADPSVEQPADEPGPNSDIKVVTDQDLKDIFDVSNIGARPEEPLFGDNDESARTSPPAEQFDRTVPGIGNTPEPPVSESAEADPEEHPEGPAADESVSEIEEIGLDAPAPAPPEEPAPVEKADEPWPAAEPPPEPESLDQSAPVEEEPASGEPPAGEDEPGARAAEPEPVEEQGEVGLDSDQFEEIGLEPGPPAETETEPRPAETEPETPPADEEASEPETPAPPEEDLAEEREAGEIEEVSLDEDTPAEAAPPRSVQEAPGESPPEEQQAPEEIEEVGASAEETTPEAEPAAESAAEPPSEELSDADQFEEAPLDEVAGKAPSIEDISPDEIVAELETRAEVGEMTAVAAGKKGELLERTAELIGELEPSGEDVMSMEELKKLFRNMDVLIKWAGEMTERLDRIEARLSGEDEE